MATIQPGRFTAEIDGAFVVFLIGMRINKVRAVRKWGQVAQAMPKMLIELAQHPEMGLLGARTYVGWREVMVVQYWRSFAHLEGYARSRDAAHLPAWQQFNRAVGTDGTVGIWHETYAVDAGRDEAIYANMPPFGLGAAGAMLPAMGGRATARERLREAFPLAT